MIRYSVWFPCKSHLSLHVYGITLYMPWVCKYVCYVCAWVSEGDEEDRFFWNRHSCVSLSVLLSEVCCDCSELETTNSSFLSASSSVPPLARAPWTPFLSSFFSCRLSRTKPGMQIMKEIVRRPRVRPRYAILGGKDVKNMIRKVLGDPHVNCRAMGTC